MTILRSARHSARRLPAVLNRALAGVGVEVRLARPGSREPAEPPAELRPAEGRAAALEHLRTACRALGSGRTHAELFRELRLLVNQLEAGGLAARDWQAPPLRERVRLRLP